MPGVKIRWVIDKKRGAENFAMRVFEIDPGASTPLHDHWYEQEMYLLAGEGVMVGATGEQHLEPGVVMWVPPYERHQIKNTGSETPVYLLRLSEETVGSRSPAPGARRTVARRHRRLARFGVRLGGAHVVRVGRHRP
jgi:quercetin dioxygenase-like cupin family protein